MLFVLSVAAGIVSGLVFFAAFALIAVVAWPVLRVLRCANDQPSAAGPHVSPPGVHDVTRST